MIRELLRRLRVGGTCAATVLLLGLAAQSWALGLGEIELKSALNEKLDARIELYEAAGLQPTEIIVSMASADDFARVGVERFFFLTDIRFEVIYDRNGVASLEVSSSQPITEPYLNFLVEVLWPNGRLLKEYTLLLDPPTFGQAAASQVTAPSRAAETASTGRVERQTTSSSGTQVQMASSSRATEPSPLDQGVVDGEYRMTDKEDTLWSIASRTRPSQNVSVHQNMLAIQRLNPDAFLHGNINYLKAGYSLKLPTEREALSMDVAEANSMVARQHEDWRAINRGEQVAEDAAAPRAASQVADAGPSDLRGQLDARSESQSASASAGAADGELRIIAGEGDSVAGIPSGAAGEQITSALEEQDRLTREVEELTYALDREKELAVNQLAVKDRQLEVKDQQIAEMQAEMARVRQELEQLQQGQNVAQSENQSAPQGAASKASEPWWQSTYAMAGAAGVLVLLLVYGLIAARRKRAEEETFDPAEALTEETAPVAEAAAGAAVAEVVGEEVHLAEAQGEEPVAETEISEQAAETQSSETSDVIGEADIYIAYGRYPQAISLLQGVLEEHPDRNDVRFKLLELFAETRDRAAFNEHMTELLERCDDEEALLSARELAQQFGDEPAALADAETPDESHLAVGNGDADEAASLDLGFTEEVAERSQAEALTGADLKQDAAEALELDADLAEQQNLSEGAGVPAATEEPETDLAFLQQDAAAQQDAVAELESNGESEANGFHEFELEFDEPSSEVAAETPAADRTDSAEEDLAELAAGAASDGGAGDQLGGDLGIDFKLDDDEINGAAEALVGDEALGGNDEALDALEDEAAVEDAFVNLDDVELDLDLTDDALDDEDEFDFGDDTDVATTKLDLARAYIDMGDEDGARDILNEVVAEGNSEQRQQAQALLDGL